MRHLRARLVVLTVLLLAQQALALAVAGALACCETDAAPAARMECCEKGEEGHMCPLNRRAPDGGCRMRNGCNPPAAGVLAGAGFVYAAPLVARFAIVRPPVDHPGWRMQPTAEPFVSLTPPTPPPKS